MRQRRETVEHPFGTIKARMGATHFLMKTLPRVASEMALHAIWEEEMHPWPVLPADIQHFPRARPVPSAS